MHGFDDESPGADAGALPLSRSVAASLPLDDQTGWITRPHSLDFSWVGRGRLGFRPSTPSCRRRANRHGREPAADAAKRAGSVWY